MDLSRETIPHFDNLNKISGPIRDIERAAMTVVPATRIATQIVAVTQVLSRPSGCNFGRSVYGTESLPLSAGRRYAFHGHRGRLL